MLTAAIITTAILTGLYLIARGIYHLIVSFAPDHPNREFVIGYLRRPADDTTAEIHFLFDCRECGYRDRKCRHHWIRRDFFFRLRPVDQRIRWICRRCNGRNTGSLVCSTEQLQLLHAERAFPLALSEAAIKKYGERYTAQTQQLADRICNAPNRERY